MEAVHRTFPSMTKALELTDFGVGSSDREGGGGAEDVHEAKKTATSANAKPRQTIATSIMPSTRPM